jgi:hypothetical protein
MHDKVHLQPPSVQGDSGEACAAHVVGRQGRYRLQFLEFVPLHSKCRPSLRTLLPVGISLEYRGKSGYVASQLVHVDVSARAEDQQVVLAPVAQQPTALVDDFLRVTCESSEALNFSAADPDLLLQVGDLCVSFELMPRCPFRAAVRLNARLTSLQARLRVEQR